MGLTNPISQNLLSFYSLLGKSGQEGDLYFVGEAAGPWPSYIVGEGEISEEEIARLALKMRKEELPAFWIHESQEDSNLEKNLKKEAIRLMKRWTGMRLEKKEKDNSSLPPGTELREINAAQEFGEWLDLVQHEVLSSRELLLADYEELLHSSQVSILGLFKKSKLVAAILLFTEGSYGGIYFVATAAEERGQGYGSYLLSAALDLGISKGVHTFVLHATSMGLGLYKRAGFEKVLSYDVYWMLGKK